jgi:hypothetical protein
MRSEAPPRKTPHPFAQEPSTAGDTVDGQITPGGADTFALVISGHGVPAALRAWLARPGRFTNATTTNSLAVADDAQALALFVRDRAALAAHVAGMPDRTASPDRPVSPRNGVRP